LGLIMDKFLIRGAAAAPGPGALAKAAEDAVRTLRRSSATKWMREHLYVVRRRLWRWHRVAARGTGRLSLVRAVAWARLKRR
jgi:hypothetical protein